MMAEPENILSIRLSTASCVPRPSAITTVSAVTPMTVPNIMKDVRSLLRLIMRRLLLITRLVFIVFPDLRLQLQLPELSPRHADRPHPRHS